MGKLLVSWGWGDRISASLDFKNLKLSLLKGYLLSIKTYFSNTKVSGCFQFYGVRWFALTANKGELFFVSKGIKIAFSEIEECSNVLTSNGYRAFHIKTRGGKKFDFKYKSFRKKLIRIVDSTYDSLDEECDDLLFSVPDIIQDEERKENFLYRWKE